MPADEAMAFEDSVTGATAASGAGVRVVGVGSGLAEHADLTRHTVTRLDPALFSQ